MEEEGEIHNSFFKETGFQIFRAKGQGAYLAR